MADISDPVLYETFLSDGKGGAITTSKVSNNKRDNSFNRVGRGEAILGSDTYWGGYVKNDNDTETLHDVVLFIDKQTQSEDDEIKIGLEPQVQTFTVNLDGKDDRINLGLQTSLWNQTQTKFSASMWFYSLDWTAQQFRNIFACQDNTDDVFLTTNSDSQPGKIIFGVTSDAYAHEATATFNLPSLNSWHHYLVVYDSTLGSNRCKIYVDSVAGSAHPSDDNVGSLGQTTKPMMIGAAYDTGTGECKGHCRDFRYWAGTALSSSDALKVFKNDPAAPAPSYKLLMNEGNGNPVDSISGTKVGTLTGGASWFRTPSFQIMQTISDINTEPMGIEWFLAPTYNQGVWVGDLLPGEWRGFWFWRHLEVTKTEVKDNRFDVVVAYDPPAGSTGGGSGSGGGDGDPTPTPGSFEDVAIAITGDWSLSSDAGDTVDNITGFSEIKLTISTGDNSYEDSGDKWASITKPLRSSGRKMKMVWGNHDAKEGTPQPELTNFYKSLMDIPNTYYTYSIGPCWFIFIDMYQKYTSGSTQYDKIKEELNKVKNNASFLWRFVFFHEPMYTSPSHYDGVDNMRTTYHKLFQDCNIDFACNGHNHNYMRTYPLSYNSGSPSSPKKFHDSQEPNYTSFAGDAVMFFQIGSAGRSSHRSLDGQASFAAKQQDSDYGFCMFKTSNGGKKMSIKFYKNSDGKAFETVTVTK
jgi:hypothetical protein